MTDDMPPSGWFEQLAEVVPMRGDRANGNAKGGRRRERGPRASAEVRSDLPVIQMTARLHEAVDASVDVLAADIDLYQRDAQLVRMVRVAEADAEREGMTVGTPQIRPIPLSILRERLTRIAAFQKFDKRSDDWVAATPNDHVVRAVHDRGEWSSVRPLTGVIETPSMRPDGSLLDVPGYDAVTGYVYIPSFAYPTISAHPTRDDAKRSLAELLEPWADFPIRTSAARYVPIAALMTLIARPAIRGACPAFLTDATSHGSGKTLIARGISTLAHGRESSLMSWPTDDTELEKVLGGYALRAASVVTFDNVTGTFGGAPLDKVLTCSDRVDLRVLGVSDVPSLSWRAVVLATGNNMAIGRDTTRRVLVCRLEPETDRPEERTGFAISNLPAWCREHHPRLVRAALTVLRGYVVAGRPDQKLAGWGSFEQWRDLIASAIVWAGGEDVSACRPTIAGDDDAETSAMRTLVACWARIAPRGTTVGSLLKSLYSPERMRGQAPPDGWDDLREAIEVIAPPARDGMAPNSKKLGKALSGVRGRFFGDVCIDRLTQEDRTGSLVWIARTA